VAAVFIRFLALVWRFVAVCGCGSDPVGEFYFTNRDRAESTVPDRIGDVMSANKPTGAKKRSVPKKVDWKALEVVPRMLQESVMC
jgi:hypothetical protein